MLAINDRHVTRLETATQQLGDIKIPVMRLPALSNQHNFSKAKEWINEFDPQWFSLQFVTFGYHPKGLNFGLGKQLAELSIGRKWHILFHELWVGMASEESAKLYWWGKLQKYLIKSLIKKLSPRVIQTQTRLYQQLLEQMGLTAGYLPLFSNIPVVAQKVTPTSSDLIFVVFGTIHSGAPVAQLAEATAQYVKQENITATLTFIGRCGAEQDRWAAIWEANGLLVNILGEQPTEVISQTLAGATMGISATALAVVEKSGSFAAMREHGLPVISLSKPWTPIGVSQPAIPHGIIPYQNNLEQCLAFVAEISTDNNVSLVSAKFADALKKAEGIL